MTTLQAFGLVAQNDADPKKGGKADPAANDKSGDQKSDSNAKKDDSNGQKKDESGGDKKDDSGGKQDDQDAKKKDESPEAKYAKRYPQPARVGDLIGWPVNDDDDRTLGHVRQIVKTPNGKILLIVSYSRWFGWFGHPVAVPLEVVAAYGKQLASREMSPDQFQKAPTWVAGTDTPLKDDDTIRVALMRR